MHGGSAVIRALLDSLGSVEGLRPAQPGEFTRRAFYSGKLDLTEVEGLADLIHAETEMQRKQALLQANGSLALLYSRWRQELLRSCAHFEAFIDFGEDENIEHDVLAQVSSNVAKVVDEMRRHLSKECGERLRTGVRTVILGEPNAGKSSFLNLLSQRSVAIISDIPGTTRDVIETSLNIGGYPVVLMDTAGLRHSTKDQVEQEGIRRARKVAENADLIIVIVNGDAVLAHWHRISELGRRTATVMTHFMDDYVRRLGIDGLDAKPKVIAINKVDLFDGDLIKSVQNCNRTGDLVVGGSGSSRDGVALLSCTTSFGLSDVISQIEAQLDSMYVYCPICIYNLLLISIRMMEIVSVRSESSANVCASLSIYLSTYIPFSVYISLQLRRTADGRESPSESITIPIFVDRMSGALGKVFN